MKKVLICCLLFLGFVCVGCKGNVQNETGNVQNEAVNVENFADDNTADGFFNRGKANLEKGNIKEALEQLSKAVEMKDDADWIIGDLGRAKKENGDVEGAIECYTKAIELNGKRSVYYSWRADAYGILGKEDLAQKDKEIAEELHNKGLD